MTTKYIINLVVLARKLANKFYEGILHSKKLKISIVVLGIQ